MNLYLISQDINRGYDTYSDAVVCAASEDEARKIHPSAGFCDTPESFREAGSYDWALDWKDVSVITIGTAAESTPKGVVCASYHAG